MCVYVFSYLMEHVHQELGSSPIVYFEVFYVQVSGMGISITYIIQNKSWVSRHKFKGVF